VIASRSTRSVRPLAVALTLAIAAFGFAGDAAAKYDAPRKFGRGLAGMTCGFLELPGNVVETTEKQGIGYGLTIGVAKGLGMIVARELIGVYEFVTAPFPAPAGYKPILQPEYPWGYFD
jgi:putative exosortase-associated protein (TIGR04073 family)